MDLNPCSMCRFQDRSQPVEIPVIGRILNRRLERPAVERVSTPAHLHDQRVDVGALGILNQLRHFFCRSYSGMKAVDPQGSEFRCVSQVCRCAQRGASLCARHRR
jgi:hypothetical protein